MEYEADLGKHPADTLARAFHSTESPLLFYDTTWGFSCAIWDYHSTTLVPYCPPTASQKTIPPHPSVWHFCKDMAMREGKADADQRYCHVNPMGLRLLVLPWGVPCLETFPKGGLGLTAQPPPSMLTPPSFFLCHQNSPKSERLLLSVCLLKSFVVEVMNNVNFMVTKKMLAYFTVCVLYFLNIIFFGCHVLNVLLSTSHHEFLICKENDHVIRCFFFFFFCIISKKNNGTLK